MKHGSVTKFDEEDRRVEDPLNLCMTHLIKRAIDDYIIGNLISPNCGGNRRRQKRVQAILSDAGDGADFINGDRLERCLKILGMEETVNVQYIRQKAKGLCVRQFNSLK